MYYNWSAILGYKLKLRIVLGRRGLGKTFLPKLRAIKRFIRDDSKCFIYVVETLEMITTLSQNQGDKFFSRILQYLEKNKSSRNNKLYDILKTKTVVQESEFHSKTSFKSVKGSYTRGGAIIINGKTAGYILAFNDFGNLKRNDFSNVSHIIIDEFIPEKIDIRSLKIPYKMVSTVQTIGRLDSTIEIDMLANPVRLDDPILVRLKLDNMKEGEFRKLYVNTKYHGRILFGIAHRPRNSDYPKFEEEADISTAGLFAQIMGESSLDDNKFVNEIPHNLLIPHHRESSFFELELYGQLGSLRIHKTKYTNSRYVMYNYGNNKSIQKVCVDKKFAAPYILFIEPYKNVLINLYMSKRVFFDSHKSWTIFKNILGLE